MKDLDALKDTLAKARASEADLRESRRQFEETRLSAFRRQLVAEADFNFGASIAEAARVRAEAQSAVDAATEAAAQAQERPIPLGTVMEEWSRGRYGLDDPRRTGRRGQLAVFTRQMERELGGHAVVGEVVIRLLKKDGTPGKTYVSGWRTDGWRPAPPTPAPPADRTDTTDGAAAS